MELVLDRKLYSGRAVQEAMEAFASLASITREGGGGQGWRLRFEAIDPEVGERVVDEFANYVLGLTAEGRLE